MPSHLRREVTLFLHKDMISKVPVFHNADKSFIAVQPAAVLVASFASGSTHSSPLVQLLSLAAHPQQSNPNLLRAHFL